MGIGEVLLGVVLVLILVEVVLNTLKSQPMVAVAENQQLLAVP